MSTETAAVSRMERAMGAAELEGPDWESTGLRLPPGLTFEKWESIGTSLSAMEAGLQWWLGDWLNYGEREYGEKYAQAVQETGRKQQTLMNYAWVAGRIPAERRRPGLSWSIHAEIAARSDSEQERLLELAESEGWTREQTREEVRRLAKQIVAGAPAPDASANGSAPHVNGGQPDSEPTPEGADDPDHGAVDIFAELEAAHAELAKLREEVEALRSQAPAELVALTERVSALEGRLQHETREKNAAVKQARSAEKVLKQLRKLLNVEKNNELAGAVTDILR